MRSLIALLLALIAVPAQAERLTVMELYTSQGCSSCPPADALLAEIAARDPAVLALSLHVTYWDRLGWRDPFSLPAATQRQRDASARLRLETVYTPQLIVDGRHQAIGSDRNQVGQAIAAARTASRPSIDLSLTPGVQELHLHAGPGLGQASLVLIGFDPVHTTQVATGENGGRTLTEVNVVRSIRSVATWTGAPLDLALPRPSGTRVAVLLQADDGRILAASVLP